MTKKKITFKYNGIDTDGEGSFMMSIPALGPTGNIELVAGDTISLNGKSFTAPRDGTYNIFKPGVRPDPTSDAALPCLYCGDLVPLISISAACKKRECQDSEEREYEAMDSEGKDYLGG